MSKMDVINARLNAGMYIDYSGNEIVNKPYNHPNDFDEYIEWIKPNFFESDRFCINSKRLEEIYNINKCNWEILSPNDIESILTIYFKRQIELVSISKVSDGLDYAWIFYYGNKSKDKSQVDNKMSLSLNELDEQRYCEIPLFLKLK